MVQILPGVDEYIRPGIEKLGDTISLFTETDRRTQKAIRNMLIENPSLIQQFADVEYKKPGSLKKMGFGSVSDLVAGVGPSLELQSEERYGERRLDLEGETLGLAERQVDLTGREMDLRGQQISSEEQNLGLEGIKTNIMKGLMQADPKLTEEQADAMVAKFLDIPTVADIDRQKDLDTVSELNALRAQRMIEMLEIGEETEGPMWGLVARARAGQVDEMEINSVLADPARREQFLLLWEDMAAKEAIINRETDNEPTEVWDLPVAIQQQYTAISPALTAMGAYALKVNNYMQRGYGSRLLGRMKLSKDEQQRIAGEIEGMKSALMGTLRPLISPGPLSKFDIDMLDKMLGNIIALRPDQVAGQLESAMNFLEGRILGLTTVYPKVKVPRVPDSMVPPELISMMKSLGMTEQEGRDYLYRIGYDVGRRSTTTETTSPSNTQGLPPEAVEAIGRYLQQYMRGDTTSRGGVK